MVNNILLNENYIGNTVYNRESFTLQERKVDNSPDLWIRIDGAIAPAVSGDVFLRAQRRSTLRWRHHDDDQLLSKLKSLLEKEGRLSQKIINNELGVPSINVYDERFGSLRNAYRRIGYELDRDFDWVDRRDEFDGLLSETASNLIGRLRKAGSVAHFQPGIDVLTVDNHFAISLRLARYWRNPGKRPIWTINRRVSMPEGHILAIRLEVGNIRVLNYLFLPTNKMTGRKIRFMEAGSSRFDGHCFETLAPLVKTVLISCRTSAKKNVKSSRASRAMSRRPKRDRTKILSKGKTGRQRR